MRRTEWGIDMRDIFRVIWPSMLSDPVGGPSTFWRWTQGAPASRRPWALLFNRFTVMSTSPRSGARTCDEIAIRAG
jgi:hypothetical protein